MSDTVEVLAAAQVAGPELDDIEHQLHQWGLRSSTRQLPARRGIAEFSWLVLLVVPAELMVRVMLERLGDEAYQALRSVGHNFQLFTPAGSVRLASTMARAIRREKRSSP